MKSFTLIEILLTVGIAAVLLSLVLPLSINFYQGQQLENTAQGVVQALRLAQSKAVSSELDSSFGFYLSGNNYLIFKGDTFASRDSRYDESFEIPASVGASGLSEIVFSKLEGRPSALGDIILSSNDFSRTININEIGRVNLQ